MATCRFHPDYQAIHDRLQKLRTRNKALSFEAYRMVNPKYTKSADIVSGQGGLNAAGRWNLRGQFCCTYLSKEPETSLQEALAVPRRKNLPDAKALPRTMVCVDVAISKVLDLTDGKTRQRLQFGQDRIRDTTWWLDNYGNTEAITQALGRAAFNLGYEGMITYSAADQPKGINFVIFPDNFQAGSSLIVTTPVPAKK